jgi:hypothetical protein
MLKALVEVPRRSAEETAVVQILADRVLDQCMPGEGRGPRLEWAKVGFPLMWDTDLVEILDLIGRTSQADERMEGALDIILAKQDKKGRWSQERTFRGRCLVPFEPIGIPSRWATLRVATMLKHLQG